MTRDNFHVITGQHVTRIIVQGVPNNTEVSNPTPGGPETGNGPSGDTNNEGFGFGPQGSTPPTAGEKVKRQDPASLNLRIQGVEVCLHPSSFCLG